MMNPTQQETRRVRRHYKIPFVMRALKMVRDGEPIRSVAKQLDVPEATLHYWCNQHDVPSPKKLVEVRVKHPKAAKRGGRKGASIIETDLMALEALIAWHRDRRADASVHPLVERLKRVVEILRARSVRRRVKDARAKERTAS